MSTPSALRQFTIIEGGGQPKPRLLRLPSTVVGPSPFRQDALLGYRLAEGDVRKALENRRRQPVFDLWSLVIGKLPPVNNISKHAWLSGRLASQSLASAHASFRGVRRPVGDDKNGFDYVVFITHPTVHFRYVASMVCVAEPVDLPTGVLLATYVRLDFPEGRPTDSRKSVAVGGVVTHWEFVEAASDDATLPVHSGERYRKRLW